MQYWKPESEEEFAGDMMPLWDGKRFHLFYLLDRHHHAEQGGLGGHQWAHASTSDLVRWEHHPLALSIGEPGSVDQRGICTGSIFEHDGVYHAFHATRIKGTEGAVSEVICRAVSSDLIHFEKSPDNPLFGAPAGLDPRNHRDPYVFRDAGTGTFHMLVTASRPPATPEEGGERGVLAHYTSEDLKEWRYQGPFLPLDKDPTPECPEHFFWNGCWYLVYSQGARMQYHLSRGPLGPWHRARRDEIEGPNLSVPRTASWTDSRRLAVGFLSWRDGGRDAGGPVYAGSTVFRELVQDADGTLATRFVPEMMPPTGPPILQGDAVLLDARHGPATALLLNAPADALVTCRLIPQAGTGEYGLLLRTDADQATGYRLQFSPDEGRVTLCPWPEGGGETRAVAEGIMGLEQSVSVVVCLKDSIIDVCLNDRHTLIERCFDHRGTHLGLFAQAREVRVEGLSISPLLCLL